MLDNDLSRVEETQSSALTLATCWTANQSMMGGKTCSQFRFAESLFSMLCFCCCFFVAMIRFDNPIIPDCELSNNPRGHQGSLPVQLRPGKPYQFLQDQAYKPFQIFTRPGKPSQYLQDQISPRVYLSGPKNTSQNIEIFYHPPRKIWSTWCCRNWCGLWIRASCFVKHFSKTCQVTNGFYKPPVQVIWMSMFFWEKSNYRRFNSDSLSHAWIRTHFKSKQWWRTPPS